MSRVRGRSVARVGPKCVRGRAVARRAARSCRAPESPEPPPGESLPRFSLATLLPPACNRAASPSARLPLDRDRRHRRGVLPVRRRPREGPQREPAGRPRDRGSDGGVGRQPQADSRRPRRRRVHAGRHAGRCGRRPRRRSRAGRCRCRSLAVLYSNYTHLVDAPVSGIRTRRRSRGQGGVDRFARAAAPR